MRTKIKKCVAVCLFAWPLITVMTAAAEELESIGADAARRIAERLSEEAKKIQNPQVMIAPDFEKAQGVHRPGEAGVLIVPQKGLKEGEELDAVKQESGAGLAFLFTYRIVPVVKDAPVQAKRLHAVTFTSGDGNQIKIHCMLLAVRQVSEDDWRLYVYGSEKKPLIDVPFRDGSGLGHKPLAVEIKTIRDSQGELVVTVFDKYQASFKVQGQSG